MSHRCSGLYRLFLGILAIVCGAGTAAAQSIDEVVKPGQVVRIDDRDGGVRIGKIFAVSPQTLELMVRGGKQTIPSGQIWSIKLAYKDSLTDGARKGALFGLAVGVALGVIGAVATCGDEPSIIDFCSGGDAAFLAAVLGAYGAGIGAATGLIGDALHPSYRTVWRAPVTSRISISVMRLPGSTGAGISFKW
jgi:hypothetical protein